MRTMAPLKLICLSHLSDLFEGGFFFLTDFQFCRILSSNRRARIVNKAFSPFGHWTSCRVNGNSNSNSVLTDIPNDQMSYCTAYRSCHIMYNWHASDFDLHMSMSQIHHPNQRLVAFKAASVAVLLVKSGGGQEYVEVFMQGLRDACAEWGDRLGNGAFSHPPLWWCTCTLDRHWTEPEGNNFSFFTPKLFSHQTFWSFHDVSARLRRSVCMYKYLKGWPVVG